MAISFNLGENNWHAGYFGGSLGLLLLHLCNCFKKLSSIGHAGKNSRMINRCPVFFPFFDIKINTFGCPWERLAEHTNTGVSFVFEFVKGQCVLCW